MILIFDLDQKLSDLLQVWFLPTLILVTVLKDRLALPMVWQYVIIYVFLKTFLLLSFGKFGSPPSSVPPFSESTDNQGGRGRRTEARQEFFSPAVWPLLRFATTNRTVPPDIHSLLPSVASSPRWTLAFFKSHSKVRWLKSTRPPCVTQPKMA